VPITKATPDRKTRVTWNEFPDSILQSQVFVARDANEIGRGPAERRDSVRLYRNLGIRLGFKHEFVERWELSTGQSEVPGTRAAAMTAYYANRKQTLSGVTYTADKPNQSSKFWRKRIATGASWESANAADQTSYPGPTITPTPVCPLDRVFTSDNIHEPNDQLQFCLLGPGTKFTATQSLATFYFSGPAGNDTKLAGIGQYALNISSDGLARLYERGSAPGIAGMSWVRRFEFKIQNFLLTEALQLVVTTDCSKSCSGSWKGTQIQFSVRSLATLGNGNKVIEMMNAVAIQTISNDLAQTVTFTASGSKDRAATPAQSRIDVRRDIRASLNLFNSVYPESGFIEDEPIPLGCFATSGTNLVVDMYCDRPDGTDIVMKLFAVDGAHAGDELTGTIVIDDCLGVQMTFAIPSGYPAMTMVQARFELSSDTTKTPTLQGYVVQRDPVVETGDSVNVVEFPNRASGGPALPAQVVRRVQINGLSAAGNSESANISVADITGEYPEIKTRSGTPIKISVDNDAGDLQSVLFSGIVQSLATKRRPQQGNYPGENAWVGDIAIANQLRRLNRKLTPSRISLFDMVANKPMFVTEAIKVLLKAAGEPENTWLFDDLPIRLFGIDLKDALIEPDQPIGDIIVQMVSDHLGGLFHWCDNSGVSGGWRILLWPRPPYNTVLRFDTNHPGSMKLRHILGAYGTATGLDGQEIQILPMFSSTLTTEPPEGNMVVVIGGSGNQSVNGDGRGQVQLVQMAVNVKSFNVLALGSGHANYPDPTHPDFLRECVPIVARDSSLVTETAINFVTRRIYDAACSARKSYKFNSLLPLITVNADGWQTRPRMPRVGDMAQVRQSDGTWENCVVASCNPQYTRAHMMRADYELVTTSRLEQIAVALGVMNNVTYVKRFTKAMQAAVGFPERTAFNPANAFGGIPRADVGGLPAATIPPIQDMDPDSATFGEFFFMLGYDPAP